MVRLKQQDGARTGSGLEHERKKRVLTLRMQNCLFAALKERGRVNRIPWCTRQPLIVEKWNRTVPLYVLDVT